MNTPKPPTIPTSGQFDTLQVNQILDNKGVSIDGSGSVVSNGYITAKGAVTTISGQDQTYSAAGVAGGTIVRTGTLFSPSSDGLPAPSELATELGLPDINGASYTRTFIVYNNTIRTLRLTNINGWTLLGTNGVGPNRPAIFYCTISYSSQDGWTAVCINDGAVVPF